MNLRFSRKIAYRYLWAKRREAFISIITVISVLGVAIGVMVLNIVMSVMTGFEHELKDKIVSTNSHIVLRKLGGKVPHWTEVRDSLLKIPGIKSVTGFTYHTALISNGGNSSGIYIKGVEPVSSGSEQLQKYMDAQDIEKLFNPGPTDVINQDELTQVVLPGIVIGRELSRSLGILTGVPVSILSSQVGSSPFGLMPRFKRFVVVGNYSSGLVEYESGLAYISLVEAQRFFGMGDTVSGLEIRVVDVDASPQLTLDVMNTVGGVSTGFYAEDWTQVNKPLWDALRLEKKVYFIVLLLIIVMASFSIITTLIMIVLEKRKDIAILKTMGAERFSVAAIFVIQGSTIGFLGTIAGLVLGYLGCFSLKRYGFPIDERIFQMSSLPIQIEPLNFALVGTSAFLICCLATIYPALRASSVQPNDILRYE